MPDPYIRRRSSAVSPTAGCPQDDGPGWSTITTRAPRARATRATARAGEWVTMWPIAMTPVFSRTDMASATVRRTSSGAGETPRRRVSPAG
ncbi:MAG: hypothetical protein QOH87_826 [Trebonia sp.]|jgi:hypothetical protein|nr:hypothetical protein [Actinomycetes bacterium]MDX6340688.1 hypothetical protein [Trebonia sp.]MDX6417013.1 hypothetical protein [Trebonia sp.]